MQLENAGRGTGAGAAADRIVDGFGFIAAIGQEYDFFGQHDGFDAHADGVAGNFFFRLEEAGIGLDGFFIEADFVGRRFEFDVRFVEADVGILTDAENLQVDAAFRFASATISFAIPSGM